MSGDFPGVPIGYTVQNQIKYKSATTAATSVFPSAPNNGAHVSVLRVTEVLGGTPTVTIDILTENGLTSYTLRTKAWTAGEVYKDYDIQLLKGETLRVASSVSNAVHVTGIYYTQPR